MELNETVTLMNSANYKERFVAEYLQTKIRYEKLKSFCNRIEAVRLHNEALPVDAPQSLKWTEPRHDCPIDLLRDQQHLMGELLHVFELRAIMERINLTEVITSVEVVQQDKEDVQHE